MADMRDQMEAALAAGPKRSLQSTLFNLAHAYARAADAAWQLGMSSSDPDFAAPAIISQSFAVELLLKFFLAADHPTAKTLDELKTAGVKLRGHKYSDLFDPLLPATKGKIADAWATLSGLPATESTFRQALLAQGEEPFVRWRYIYEVDGVSHFDREAFNHITDALGSAAAEIRKRTQNS